ncbi:MAG: FUSC family protein [Solirubrobacteraceae bacterium]
MTDAVRAAARFDRRMVSIPAGALAAVPVAAVLGGGIALGHAVPGVTMAAGAMLVGIAWRVTGGRPPLALMATDATIMALSTFVGCVTGSTTWLHVLVLVLWSLIGGLLVGVGNRGGVIGIQAIVAVVVFGRFSEPAPEAVGLAALVLTGGLAQVAFLTVVRWPPPLRAQRNATANAYRVLAELASAPSRPSTLPAGAALDDAAASLSSPAMFGDAALMALRSLVSEGYRLRVQIAAIHALSRQDLDDRARAGGHGALSLAADAMRAAAEAITGDGAAAERLAQAVARFDTEADAHAEAAAPSAADPSLAAPAGHLARRLAALGGQLRAISSQAAAAGRGGGLRSRRPHGGARRPMGQRVRAGAEQLRAGISLQSPAGRHAVRLAVIVPAAVLLARTLPLQRSYWVTVAAATVLRPEFGATFTRGAERAIGTCAGVALAGAISVAFHPGAALVVGLVGALAWAGYATFPASFAVGFGFITALVVFLLNAVNPDTLQVAGARLLDTLVGGAIGLIAYAAWPTWAYLPAWQSLADLVAAQRAYLDAVLRAAVDGSRPPDAELRALARRARQQRIVAGATVARSLSEPSTRRIDADASERALGTMRRLIEAVHVLRLDAQEDREREPLPSLEPLRSDLRTLLATAEQSLRAGAHADGSAPADLPDLRADHGAFARGCAQRPEATALLDSLDEIVDAANGLAVAAGLRIDADPGDGD